MTDKPMTVGELIEKLEEFDPKLPVFVYGDYGYYPMSDTYCVADYIQSYNDDYCAPCSKDSTDAFKAALIA